ncbi:MAG: dihydroorotate dehydrogenase [Candidatus Magasanikbacteria bacterium CG10_big_fil_rev_8_21_14_0_10_47_10]|uniref:Dihydroorotate dehydrogenase n=1 Tax=Candidatus Magasanikbacteria bacterium CG10_big_fil_rev_8_21_14_0_10_47_10 TaxID=1974652 RepID=A0A2H0TS02_9BACT|nr:MAG: dihydroorotate dehydrogenase [Candidatus Magasanikbacteria bacterium CG10_big_fil_rev_8_21_14_0_10_47_10]
MLHTSFLSIPFHNPLVLASGILGVSAASMNHVVDNGAGGVTVKSLSKEPRTGHANPTMIASDTHMLNAVGLSNPGIDHGLGELRMFKQRSTAPLIGSIFASTPEEFADVAKKISTAPIDILELDISCPNVSTEFGEPFAYSPHAILTIIKKVKAVTDKPISIKLSPNAWNIAALARVAEQAGADAITAVNTVSGMQINVQARMPVLHNKYGGVSGPALFPIALKCVYDIYAAVNIPIIATGGVTTGEDALAMIMAGATLVGVGSAVYYRGTGVFQKIVVEMQQIMQDEGIASLDEIRGVAHAS